jgi:hypothetical protein
MCELNKQIKDFPTIKSAKPTHLQLQAQVWQGSNVQTSTPTLHEFPSVPPGYSIPLYNPKWGKYCNLVCYPRQFPEQVQQSQSAMIQKSCQM